MNIVKLPGRRCLKSLLAVGLLLGLSASWAEAQDQSASPTQTPQDQNQSEKQSDKPAPSGAEGSVQPAPDQKPAGAAKPSPEDREVKITPRQAEELFHSVDEILAFDSKASGLPIKK